MKLGSGPRPVQHADWIEEGKARFGPDVRKWRFKCPSCGHVQTFEDFVALGMNPNQAQTIVGFSCIGRWRTSTALNVVGFGELDKGSGCNYAGGGLFRIAPTLVKFEGGERYTFGWDGE
jgi:hypothetical protein